MKKRLLLGAAVAAVGAFIFAPAAQADVTSCVFGGATGNIASIDSVVAGDPAGDNEVGGGVESAGTDIADGAQGDGLIAADPLLDTDDGGTGLAPAGWTVPDGDYTFNNAHVPPFIDGTGKFGACLYVDDELAGANDHASGLYDAQIASAGSYDNIVCGTGFAGDGARFSVAGGPPQGPTFPDKATTVGLGATVLVEPGKPAPPAVTDVDYAILFSAGQGVLDVDRVETPANVQVDEANDIPEGTVNIVPTQNEGQVAGNPGESCGTADPTPANATNNAGSGDVKQFNAQGTFTVNLGGQ